MFLTIFVTLMALATCDCQILTAREGSVTELNFPYPCESTRVTLQHGNGAPFYSSAKPELIPSSPNLGIVRDDDLCYLNLTFHPVLRSNEGTFILFAYDKGDILTDFQRIGLRITYPPGKASCGSSREYIAGEWIAIQCTAPEGSLQGKIVCHQNDMQLPHLTTPETHGRSVRQVILARFVDHRIFCCSCTIEQTKDKCSCNDWDWDPVRSISNNTDPCPDAQGTQSPPSSQEPASITEMSSTVSSLISPATSSDNENESCQNVVTGLYVAVGILVAIFAIFIIIIIVGVWKVKHRKTCLRKQKYRTEVRVNGNDQLTSLHDWPQLRNGRNSPTLDVIRPGFEIDSRM